MTLQKPRVLIVDDRPANVHALAEALGNDHEVLLAGTFARTFELAPSCDLVLLGTTSDLDALEACRRLSTGEATKGIPVIFVTALDATQGLEAGAVDGIAEPIAAAIVRARVRTHLDLKAARALLERLATTDPLTGLANRRRFDEAVQEEWRRSMRTSHLLTLVLADLDHFKAFNDSHGHEGGDACLRAVASALQPLCRRPGELVARHRGEEFAFLLPDVDAEAARIFVSRTLRAVASVEVFGIAASGSVSVSVGGVTLIPSPLNSLEHALGVAREGMHKAKGAGRGRGVVQDLESGAVFEVLPGV